MNANDFVNSLNALIAQGATNDQIVAAIKTQQAAELAEVEAQQAALAQQAATLAKIAKCTPVMLSNIGLSNGMTQDEIITKIDFYYPDLMSQ